MQIEPERLDERIGAVADCGDDGAGRDQAAVRQLHRSRRGGLGADAGHDVDAALAELLRRVIGEIGGKGRQDARRVLDEMDLDLLVLDVRVVAERAINQLVDLRHGLDAGEAGADDDESEQLLLQLRVGRHVRHLQAADDVGAEAMRVGEVLHRQRMLGQTRETLQIDGGAKRDD